MLSFSGSKTAEQFSHHAIIPGPPAAPGTEAAPTMNSNDPAADFEAAIKRLQGDPFGCNQPLPPGRYSASGEAWRATQPQRKTMNYDNIGARRWNDIPWKERSILDKIGYSSCV